MAGLAVGTAIGAGIFRVPQSISALLPFPGAILLVWLAGGLIALSGSWVYGELARRFPDMGGDYAYLRSAFRGPFGFLFAWTKIFLVQPASIAALSLIFAAYFRSWLPEVPLGEKPIALLAILFLAAINYLGIQRGIFIQNVSTILKVGCIGLVALGAFIHWPENNSNLMPLFPEDLDLPAFQAFGLALLFVLWTYGGWNEGVFLAGEMRSPRKELPRGLVAGVLVIMGIYLAANIAYYLHIPVAVMAATDSPAALLVSSIFGKAASHWIALLIAISCFGALNSLILTGGRVSYALARDTSWLAGLSQIHPRFLSPGRGIFLMAGLSTAMVITGTFERLVVFESIIVWFFFLLIALVLAKIFCEEANRGKPPAWIRWVPLSIYGITGVGLVVNTVLSAPWESGMGALLTLLGLPFFYFGRRARDVKDRPIKI